MVKRWVKEDIEKLLADGTSLNQLLSMSSAAYRAAKKFGLYDQFPKKFHIKSLDDCRKLTNGFSTRTEFKAAYPVAYKRLREAGEIQALFAHAHFDWASADLDAILAACSTRAEFRKKFSSAGRTAGLSAERLNAALDKRFGPRKYAQGAAGSVFGKWTLVEKCGNGFWIAKCECGTARQVSFSDLGHGKSRSCGCAMSDTAAFSSEELEVFYYLQSIGVQVEHQAYVDGWSYDMRVMEKKLLIEYNGVYWHSSAKPVMSGNPKRHLIKRRSAEDAGYRLVSVWSDDWKNNPDRVKKHLAKLCGVSRPRTVGARVLRIATIEPSLANQHHLEYHMQTGRPQSTVAVGLFLKDELIVAASVFDRGSHLELTRMTVKEGFSCPGTLKKIMNFLGPNRQWVTYCDRDYFDGGLYRAAGFTSVGVTTQLSYLDKTKTRVRREKYMKHKLPEVLGATPDEMATMTEHEICAKYRVYACYNSGIEKFVYNPPALQ